MNEDGRIGIDDITMLIEEYLNWGEGDDDGNPYVDLGLPSGTLWAKCNVGAASPEQYGDFVAWAETESKSDYSWDAYKWIQNWRMTKYSVVYYQAYGNEPDKKTLLDAEDDIAAVKMGEGWRMPTKYEVEELFNPEYTTWTWAELNGVKGVIVASKTKEAAIFLPAAGSWSMTYYYGEGDNGSYWTRSLMSEEATRAYQFSFSSSYHECAELNRYYGCTVRAVRGGNPNPVILCESIQLDKSSIEINVGDDIKINETITPSDATNSSVEWSSSDESIATVSETGLVTGVGVGEAIITVSSVDGSGVKATCVVKVIRSATHLDMSKNPLRMTMGENTTLTVIYTPEDATNKGVVWTSSNTEVATVVNGAVCAVSEGEANITATLADGSGLKTVCHVIVQPMHNGHAYVDLGLPSGLLWATCNVGADVEEEVGNYYAWGETETKEVYTFETYKWNTISKYQELAKGSVLEPGDDVAHVKWQGAWRMPSWKEIKELRDNCTWKYTNVNGVKGYNISRNGKSIFLPLTGLIWNDIINFVDDTKYGGYWANECWPQLESHNNWRADAYAIYFYDDGRRLISSNYQSRFNGLCVRPVCDPASLRGIELSHTDLSMVVADKVTLVAVPKPDNVNASGFEWSSSDENVATVKDGVVTALHSGTAIITVTAVDSKVKAECEIKVGLPPYVDLGLPSGVKWATVNLGTTSSMADYGGYYAWGETEPKEIYSKSTYKWMDSNEQFTKYCAHSEDGVVDDKLVLDLEDDAAYVALGEGWRMPTYAEMRELSDKQFCTWEFDTVNEVYGVRITSKINGNSIFLPAAGLSLENEHGHLQGSYGEYWTSELFVDNGNSGAATFFSINNDDNALRPYSTRVHGKSIRPVYVGKEEPVKVDYITISRSSLTLKEGFGTALSAQVYPAEAVNRDITWTTSDASVATVNDGVISAISKGKATITVMALDGSGVKAECELTVERDTANIPVVHEYVDLGLPSGTKWATCNLGANAPEETGDYYMWGDLSKHKTAYAHISGPAYDYNGWGLYKWGDVAYAVLKYTSYDKKAELELDDDAAHVKWGGTWRIPTKEQQEELMNTEYCTWTWTSQNGMYGYKVTSVANGKSIFLPTPGHANTYHNAGPAISGANEGSYWSRTLFDKNHTQAYSMYIACMPEEGDQPFFMSDTSERTYGLSIRPVCK